MVKNKCKAKTVLKEQQKRHNEEQRKMDSNAFFFAEQSQDSETSLSSDAGEEDPDFGVPETSKKRKHIQEK